MSEFERLDFMRVRSVALLIIVVMFSLFSPVSGAENKEVEKVFAKIEKGFTEGKVSNFEPYIIDKVFISLFTGTAGYFTRNHARSLLEDFFTYHKSSGFYFVSTKTETDTPFASGKFKYFYKGILRTGNVFISLKKHKEKWIISQITID
ncbi:MAG: hypothetical protein SCALA702_22600 [Melioribacteraceae bacterium]|nr:MAG: hypothetical protein SCALA702_22600 [Melioribacteraceae bacterium]